MWRYLVRSGGRAGSLLKGHYGNHVRADGPHPPLTRPFTSGTLIYPEAPSKDQHNDLPSYIAYAERINLDVESQVFVGTHYEYSVTSALCALGFDLRRVGGQSDKGIDLLGTWSVPSTPENLPMRVLLQCKAYSSAKTARVGPQHIRELEGAYLGAPPGWRGSGVLALLVTQRPATKGIRDALANSRWPIGYVSCSRDGMLGQMLWNRRAEEEGLEGMGVTVKLSDDDRHGVAQRLVLTWKGRPFVSSRPPPALDPEEVAEHRHEVKGDAKPSE
ncbi:putative conserved fungal protein [Rosellinia necatrix]|uniref:Putative conserved fungal protein n=1 Tax=Rosellinia necatrix TaxID=77044 RepID=A0A1W2TB25_ROSNE|nr:putative conserved fungal protein [Rosellinia necatrix]